jgi:hypothetical protein
VARAGCRSFTTYQPGYRFWPFPFIETGIFAALAAALIVVTFLVVRRSGAWRQAGVARGVRSA